MLLRVRLIHYHNINRIAKRQPCVTVMMMDCCRVFKYMDASTQAKATDTVTSTSLAPTNEALEEMNRTVFIFGCQPNGFVSDIGDGVHDRCWTCSSGFVSASISCIRI